MNDFSRHDLDALKAQVDLAALMRQAGIDLQPAGKNLKACCPWHDDKTPSLVLNPAKGSTTASAAKPRATFWTSFSARRAFRLARR